MTFSVGWYMHVGYNSIMKYHASFNRLELILSIWNSLSALITRNKLIIIGRLTTYAAPRLNSKIHLADSIMIGPALPAVFFTTHFIL